MSAYRPHQRSSWGEVEICTTVIEEEEDVFAKANVLLAEDPLPVPGEAMAVICPGWGDEVDGIELFWGNGEPYKGKVTDEQMKRIEEELILKAAELQNDHWSGYGEDNL